MKRMIVAATNKQLVLKAVYEAYRDNYEYKKRTSATGPDLKSALLNLLNKLPSFYEPDEDVDDMSAEDLLRWIKSVNGDGADDILSLYDANSGIVYIGEGPRQKSNEDIQLDIVKSRATPPDEIDSYVDSPFVSVRRYVAKRSKNPEVLEELSQDTDAKVLENLSSNSATPKDLKIEIALRDDSPETTIYPVRDIISPNMIDSLSEYKKRMLAGGSRNRKVLVELFDKFDNEVHKALARNPYLPIDILVELASDSNPYIRFHVVITSWKRLPADIQEELLNDPDLEVRRRAEEEARH